MSVIELTLLPGQYEALTFDQKGFTDWWYDGGVGTGKTFVAPRWFHRQMVEQGPGALGFIGANDFKQLNQAVLPPFLQYLQSRGIDYVINRKPPKAWGVKSPFPSHDGILTLSTGNQVIVKQMKENFHIAGIQIAYWWVDEVGDVPEEAFNKLRERRRQPGYKHVGLITGTPGGPVHFTARDYHSPATRLARHGFSLAKTRDAAKAGFVTWEYYMFLCSSYSKRKGMARLDGEIINSEQLLAYESHDIKKNSRVANPFNKGAPADRVHLPATHMPIGVFCDFNVRKKCIWELGQFDYLHTHCFDEVALETLKVENMFNEIIRRYGRWPQGFHFFGDASGTREELTSGKAVFEVIRQMCAAMKIRAQFTLKGSNPTRADRLEAMNASLCAFDGSVKLTYNEYRCPHLHLDFLRVGWDGVKLLDGGDPDRTHASDGVGYHVYAVRPVRGPAYLPITHSGGGYSG